MKFHKILAVFIVSLFTDIDYALPFMTIHPIDIFLLGVVAYSILTFKRLPFKHNSASLGFLFFIFFIVVNGLTKVPVGFVARESIQILEYLLLMFLIADSTSNSDDRKEFLNILFWGTGLIAFVTVLYHFSIGKYAGFKDLGNPKHSFAFFSMLAILKYFTDGKRTTWQLTIVIVSLLITLLGGERKGWAGLLAGLGYFLYIQLSTSAGKKNVKSIFKFSLVMLSLAIFVGLFITTLSEFRYFDRQLSSVTDFAAHLFSEDTSDVYASSSNEERIVMFNFSIKLFQQYPLFGIGINEFREYATKGTRGLISNDAHNFFLKVLVEEGIVGFLFFLIPVGLLFKELHNRSRFKNLEISTIAQILTAIFLLGTVVKSFPG